MIWTSLEATQSSLRSHSCSRLNKLLPETMKVFDYSVFGFPFSGIIWGVFEFRISFSRPIYLGVQISGFEFCFGRIIFCVSEFRISCLRTIHDFHLCWCCPAGGLDFEKSRFSFLLMLPYGRPRSWSITFFVFVACPPSVKTALFRCISASKVC